MNTHPDELITRIQYKENWTYEIDRVLLPAVGMAYLVSLRICIKVPDAFADRITTVQTQFQFEWDGTESHFFLKVMESFMKLELHEAMEFFKVDCVSIYSPDHNYAPWNPPVGVKLHD